MLSGSYTSAEAIAHIMTQKFVMGSPLYRQEQERYCSALFSLEKEFSNLTAEERYKQGQERAKPLLDALLAWTETK